MQWEADITGEASTLEQLTRTFAGQPVRIVRKGDRFLLSGDAFAGIENAGDAKAKADELATLLEGACRLVLGGPHKLTIGAVYKRAEDGSRAVYVFPQTGVLQIRGHAPSIVVTKADGSTVRYDPADPVRDCLEYAQNDEDARKALRLLAYGELDWVELYRLMEVVQAAIGKTQLEGWLGAAVLRRFKHTANSVSAAGDAARHGHESTAAPKDPMSLSDARELVSRALMRWLSEK